MKVTITRHYDVCKETVPAVIELAQFVEKLSYRVEELLDHPYPVVDAALEILKEDHGMILVPQDAYYDHLQAVGK